MTRLLQSLDQRQTPFELVLDTPPTQPQQTLFCREVVRAVRGRRLVCQAEWQGKPVYAKLYFDARRARRHQLREIRGLHALAMGGISSPAVLCRGTAEHGHVHVIVLAEIANAQSVLAAWKEAADESSRTQLLRALVEVLARHHSHRIVQRDLHLDNFLIAGGAVHTLDGSTIRTAGGPVGTVRSLDNLARLLAQLTPRYDHLIDHVVLWYAQARGWNSMGRFAALLRFRVKRLRVARREHYLKKLFRECTEFAVHRSPSQFSVCRREACSPELLNLMDDPDASFFLPGVRVLKSGNTCTVWSVPLENRRVVVKRYNMKSFGHRLNRALRPSRAASSWRNAHRLRFYGIRTATPLAMVEKRLGPMRGTAFFISEEVIGTQCDELFTSSGATRHDRVAAAKAIGGLLQTMAEQGIRHGDMKATNIIVDGAGPVVLDLEAMRQYKLSLWFRQRKDYDRFMRNWEHDSENAQLFADVLRRSRYHVTN